MTGSRYLCLMTSALLLLKVGRLLRRVSDRNHGKFYVILHTNIFFCVFSVFSCQMFSFMVTVLWGIFVVNSFSISSIRIRHVSTFSPVPCIAFPLFFSYSIFT